MSARGSKQPASDRSHDTAKVLTVCAALAVLVLVLYAQTAGFEFLTLDDYNFLLHRPQVRDGLTVQGMRWAVSTVDPNWHPVTWLTHQLDFSLFGVNAGGHHLVSAGLHAVNAALCFLALRALTGALWPSALVAALFAVHPMRAESVAWLSERKDLTSGFFWMVTLLAYARYVRRPTTGRYVALFGAFALGLMSKTMLVSLPIILLLLDIWPLERLQWWPTSSKPAPGRPPARSGAPLPSSVSSPLIEKLPLLALVVAGSAITVFTQQTVGGVRSLDQMSIAWRLVNAPIAYATYLAQTVWPTHLAVIYPHPAMIAAVQLGDYVWPAMAATVFLVAITAGSLALLRPAPYLAVGWLWYLVALAPVIGLMQIGQQAHADRYTYLPMLGVYVMVAWGLRDTLVHWPRARVPALAAVVLVLAVFTVMSWRQIGTWRNSRTVFEHALAVTDNNYYAHQTLGANLLGEGNLDQARSHLEEALRIKPSSAYAAEQLGLLLERTGDRTGAARQYEHALALSWKSFYARLNLAAIRRADGDLDGAIKLWTDAVQHQPNDAQLRFDLGTALLQRERYAEATAQLRRAVELWPNSAAAHNNLGVALVKQGELTAAMPQFERALALDPHHATARKSADWVRAQQGQR